MNITPPNKKLSENQIRRMLIKSFMGAFSRVFWVGGFAFAINKDCKGDQSQDHKDHGDDEGSREGVLVGANKFRLEAGVEDELFEGGIGAEDKYAGRVSVHDRSDNKDVHVFGENPFFERKVFGFIFSGVGEEIGGDLGGDSGGEGGDFLGGTVPEVVGDCVCERPIVSGYDVAGDPPEGAGEGEWGV